MIRIVQGNPGSGKSFYAVNYLSKFCNYDSLYQEYTLNDGVLVITNIEGLRIKHLNLSELIERYGIEGFFTVDNFERIREKYRCRHIVLIIDEAQKVFDSKYYDKNVFYFFQYHRHLGIDIFLLTQSVSTISRQLLPLAEFVIEAQPRSKAFYGVFRYKFKDIKGNFLFSQACRKKPELFKMYTSFNSDEVEKPRNVIVYWCCFAVAFFLVAGIGFKVVIGSLKSSGKKKPAVEKVQPAQDITRPAPKAIPVETIPERDPITLSGQVHEAPPTLSYWKSVPVLGKVESDGKRFVMLTDGSRCFKFKNYDWYASTADVPADVAARVPAPAGREPQSPALPPSSIETGSFATGHEADDRRPPSEL